MSRILITLGSLSLIVMGAALCLGLSVGSLYEAPSEATLRMATVHRLTGVAAAIGVIFVESIIVTYFVGTSRWCREVVDTYRLESGPVVASQQLKQRAFPWALAGMLTVVVVSALGAAGDPATGRVGTQWWSTIHLGAALSGLAFIGWTYFMAWNRVVENQALINGLVAEVAQVRKERGLDGS